MVGGTYKDVAGELAAYTFAKTAHAACGQFRKYTNEPYIVHPVEVAMLVRNAGGNSYMVQAAYLHDVIEDTHITFDHLVEEFGIEVATLVNWLSDKSKLEDGNRLARKEIDRNWIALAPHEAKTIKLADLISNTRSIVLHDLTFAQVYLHEKELMMEVLKEGDPSLYCKAKSLLIDGKLKIEQGRLECALNTPMRS